MAPTTTFEDTGGSTWTPLDDEASFLQVIASETDAQLFNVGQSVNGNTMWRIDIGVPTNGTMFVTALSHGTERASREGALAWIRDLAYDTDSAVTDYLSLHRVVVMPTCNPDAIPVGGKFLNADNIDINRDVFAFVTPEQRAMMSVQRSLTEATLRVDCHEADQNTNDMSHSHADWAAYYSEILVMGEAAIEQLKTDLDGAGVTHEPYPNPSRKSGHQIAGAFHSVGILLESRIANPRLERLSDYGESLESLRGWHGDNDMDLLQMQADSKAFQASTNSIYVLETGTTGSDDDPWPQIVLPDNLIGYELENPIPTLQRQTYGVEISGQSTVFLSQEARAVVPVLLDSLSTDTLVAAERILDGEDGGESDPETGIVLDPGVFNPVIQWKSFDLVTGNLIADLPDADGEFSRVLGEYTSSEITLPIPLDGDSSLKDVAFQATVPGRTILVAVVNEQPAWGGIVLTRTGIADKLSLGCVSVEGYLARRTVRDHIWEDRDIVSVIAAGIASDAGDLPGVGSGIGLEIDAPDSGINIDAEFLASDKSTVYEKLKALMELENGPEWTIDLLWTDSTHQTIRKVLRIRPRIGEESSGALFETQNNTVYQYTEDYSDKSGANYIVAYSSGEGEDQPESDPAIDQEMIDEGMPIFELHWQPDSDETSKDKLNSYAREDLNNRSRGVITWELEAEWNSSPRLNIDWRLGDTIAWKFTSHRHPKGVEGSGRCIGWRLNPKEGKVYPILLDPLSGG